MDYRQLTPTNWKSFRSYISTALSIQARYPLVLVVSPINICVINFFCEGSSKCHKTTTSQSVQIRDGLRWRLAILWLYDWFRWRLRWRLDNDYLVEMTAVRYSPDRGVFEDENSVYELESDKTETITTSNITAPQLSTTLPYSLHSYCHHCRFINNT